MTTVTSLPVVRRKNRSTQHAVWADGSSADGSLVGFSTLCGLQITTRWAEVEPREVSCLNCLRCLKSIRVDGAGRNP